jgi:methionine-rich copper-binding protein CopC
VEKIPPQGALLLAACLVVPASALAHAIILESRPAPNAAVAGPRIPIELRFNSRIDRKRSLLTLARSDGTATSVTLDATDQPDRMTAHLDGLPPGSYKLKWQVLAVDGHITRGDIPFRVGGP